MTDDRAPTLVCPRCRRPSEAAPVVPPLTVAADGALLVCSNPACGAAYPVLDGVPVVLRDLEAWLRHQASGAHAPLAGDTAWDTALAWLPADDPLRQGREALAAAAAGALAPWTEGARPARSGDEDAPATGAPLARWLDAWLPASATNAVDLGCGVGAASLALALRGLTVVALDVLLPPLRLLRRLRDDGMADVPSRLVGSRYRSARCTLPFPLPKDRLTILAADALDPPLEAHAFDVVHAASVLDNVRSPLLLLGQADALLRPGGRLFLTCASSYRADITPEIEWLGASGRAGGTAAGPEEVLRAVLAGRHPALPHLRYQLLDDRPNLAWQVPRDDRCMVTYQVHAVVAEKLGD